MPEVVFHRKALAEAARSALYYDRQRPGLGADFFEELDAVTGEAAKDPLCQPADKDSVRSWRLERFPFRVYYVIEPSCIRMLAVAHASRRPDYWRPRIDD